MQKKQNKTNNRQTVAQQNKGEKDMKKQTVQPVAKLDDKVVELINDAVKTDKLISTQQNTGHIAVKYGNKVMFEYHAKKRSISHLTFASSDKVLEILKAKNLILRIVPKTYGWRVDTECLLTADFLKEFPAILKNVIAQAIEERNLKSAPKKEAKKA